LELARDCFALLSVLKPVFRVFMLKINQKPFEGWPMDLGLLGWVARLQAKLLEMNLQICKP
jgi:hypothetical protein